METREDILKELKAIAPKLAAMEKTNPYQVDESYFLNFKNAMLERIMLAPTTATEELKGVAPLLSEIKKTAKVEVPANYFSSFSGGLIEKIRIAEVKNELAQIAPCLSELEKVNALQVPANYFSSFPAKMQQLVSQKQEAESRQPAWIESLNASLDKLIAVVFKPKYSLAFSGFATMLILGVMLLTKVQQCEDLDCKFAKLSTDEINSYLDNKSDAYGDEIFEMKVDDKALPATEKVNTVPLYKDALKDVDDAALNEAITD